MKNLKINTIVLAELEKLILLTDEIKEVEPTTNKHYSLNQKFEVIRNGKKYFVSVKIVDVIGVEKKSHIRLEVDTDLPSKSEENDKSEKLDKKRNRIIELKEKMKNAKEKGLLGWYSVYKKELYKLEISLSKMS